MNNNKIQTPPLPLPLKGGECPADGSYAVKCPADGSYAVKCPADGSYAVKCPADGSYAVKCPAEGSYAVATPLPSQGRGRGGVSNFSYIEVSNNESTLKSRTKSVY